MSFPIKDNYIEHLFMYDREEDYFWCFNQFIYSGWKYRQTYKACDSLSMKYHTAHTADWIIG